MLVERILRSLQTPLGTRLGLWGGFLLALLLLAYLFAPYFQALFLGAILATLLLPAHRFLHLRFRIPPKLSALVLTLFTFLLFLAFIAFAVALFLPQFATVATEVEKIILDPEHLKEKLAKVLPLLKHFRVEPEQFFEFLRVKILQAGTEVIQNLANALKSTLRFTATLIIHLFITFLSAYSFILFSPELKRFGERFSPLPPELKGEFTRQFRAAIQAFFIGGVCTAVVQAAVATIGYALVGLKGLLALFFLTMLASFIPFFGTFLVWGPVVLYFLLSGEIGKGVFLGLYGVGIVSTLDQWIKPLLIGNALELPMVVMFLTFFAGIKTFGFAGIILGPLIFAYFLSITRVLMGNQGEPALAGTPGQDPRQEKGEGREV